MKVLVLGHKGLLGNAVTNYYKRNEVKVITTDHRWPDKGFLDILHDEDFDFVVNCIGSIPQKHPVDYSSANIVLPLYMAALGLRMVHPSTDCEFKGFPSDRHFYEKTDKTDAEDAYGVSKRLGTSILLERYPKTVRALRTSIVGIELGQGNRSLLGWFLSQNGTVTGYVNHFWNGVTTLEWAKQSLKILSLFENTPPLTQIGTDPVSKYELLCSFAKVFGKDIKVMPLSAEDRLINKCLKSDFEVDHLEDQLRELKAFYNL